MSLTKQQIIEILTRKLATSASTIHVCTDGARVVLELLKQPTLPKEPTNEMIQAMASGVVDTSNVGVFEREYNALYNHLTAPPKPKTKKIKVWRVEWYNPYLGGMISSQPHIDRVAAETFSKQLADSSVCINIVEGEQEVPA